MNSMSSPIGVAEQFAIAEAKLRAWSSVDGEDSTDESYDEDFAGGTDSGEGHPMLVLPAGVGLPDRPCDSELSLQKGRSRMSSTFGKGEERDRLCLGSPGHSRARISV